MKGGSSKKIMIPVSGGKLAAELQRSLDGNPRAPLLFLHGWTLDHRMWAPQAAALSARYPVITVDRRGFGQSTAPAALHLEPDDVLAIQDHFGVRRAVIIGMSQAGRIALEFAARHPLRTAALVLEGAGLPKFTPPPASEEQIPITHFRRLVKAGKIADMRDEWRRHPLMHTPNPDAAKLLADILASYDGRDLLEPPSPPFGIALNELDRIKAPVLVVAGDQETLWRRLVADTIAGVVPKAERAVIDKAGHACNLCNPEKYNAVLAAFLERVL